MTVTPASRDRHAEVRSRNAEARSTRKRARDAVDAARAAQDMQAEAVATIALDRAQQDVEVGEALERALLGQMAGLSSGYSESFLDDPAQVAMLDRLANTQASIERLDLGPLSSVDTLVERINTGTWDMPKMAASIVPDTGVGRRGPFSELGLVQQPRRRLRLLDLIPTSEAIGNTIPYVIESGSFDTAAETAESALKPVGDIGLTDSEAPIRTIAHFLKSPRQILADVPGLQQLLQTRLEYACLRRLEAQILSGDGLVQNLRGITQTAGVGSVAYNAATPLADLSLAGLVTVLNSEGEPDAAVMNATTLQSLLTPKASGSGQYLNIDSPFGDGPNNLSLWGVNVIVSTVMPTGQVLFGQFGQGCHLWVREAVNVIVGLDTDDLTRNRLTLLGEMRAGITINVPSYFTIVHLS